MDQHPWAACQGAQTGIYRMIPFCPSRYYSLNLLKTVYLHDLPAHSSNFCHTSYQDYLICHAALKSI